MWVSLVPGSIKTLPKLNIFINKIFTIAFVGNLYFLIVIMFSYGIKKYISVKYDKKKKPINNYFRLFLIVSSILISNYIIKQILEVIPLVKFGNEFNPRRVEETRGTLLNTVAFLIVLSEDLLSYKELFISG